jgi:hypothetical protein
MDTKINVRTQIFDLIKNQMNENNPPETNLTYNRLLNLGLTQFQTRQLIGQCIVVELEELMKNETPFNVERYIRNLKNLPNEPMSL